MRHKRPTGSYQRPFWSLHPEHPDHPDHGRRAAEPPPTVSTESPEQTVAVIDAEGAESMPVATYRRMIDPVDTGDRERVRARGHHRGRLVLAIGALFLVGALLKPWGALTQGGATVPDVAAPSEAVQGAVQTRPADLAPVTAAPSPAQTDSAWIVIIPDWGPGTGARAAGTRPPTGSRATGTFDPTQVWQISQP